jgi:hypothetical protein
MLGKSYKMAMRYKCEESIPPCHKNNTLAALTSTLSHVILHLHHTTVRYHVNNIMFKRTLILQMYREWNDSLIFKDQHTWI